MIIPSVLISWTGHWLKYPILGALNHGIICRVFTQYSDLDKNYN